jgi:hypothetical protein
MWYRKFRAILSKAGHAVAHLVESLRYKLKVVSSIPIDVSGMIGRTGVDSASNRNEYWEYFLGVKAAGAYG